MLEDRIIVQDRGGIDAGLAALMQNANTRYHKHSEESI